MNNSIPQSVAEFYQLAKAQGITLPKSLSIYEQIRLYICRAHPDTPEEWGVLESRYISSVMRNAPEPISEDTGEHMIA